MSKSKTKSSSTSNSTSNAVTNSTTTPTVAPWLESGYQGLNDLIGKFAQTSPNQYVAGSNPTLNTAMTGAQNLGGWQDTVNSAVSGLQRFGSGNVPQAGPAALVNAPGVGATSILDFDRSKYENPYTKDVLDTTINDFDVNAGRTRAAQEAQAAANRAFGGSRYAVREAQTEGELARGRASTAANIRDQAFQQATAQMQADAERKQAAALMSAQMAMQAEMQNAGAKNSMAQFNTGLQNSGLDRSLAATQAIGNFGLAAGAGQRDDITSQLQAGQTQYGIDQAQAQALPDWLKNISSLYGSIPIGSFTSLNQAGTSSGTQSGSQTGKTSTTSAGFGWSPKTGFTFGG